MKNLILAFCLFSYVISTSQYSISGKVTNSKNEPIAWANVVLKESNYVVTTDLKGEYTLKNIPNGNKTIEVSFIGYETHKKKILIEGKNLVDVNITLLQKEYMANEIVVSSTRIDEKTPGATSTLTKEEIENTNLGQDIPILMDNEPNIVTTSDAGAGVGYTGMRIRGTDITRINVTVNGVPLNDPESHGVFWVNMPDFASSLENIQVQRGAGTSTNGAGAFGASVNLLTDDISKLAYGEINNSFGSFNTMKNTVKFGTGRINNRFAFEGRLSSIQSDGYIDRASSNLQSYYLSGQYTDSKNSLRFITFSGKEVTYQAWYGTPRARLENDSAGIEDYIINNGLTPEQAENLRNSDRRYNHYLYENETDNYEQTHYQLFYNRNLQDNLLLNIGLHYTIGQGYYEQYRDNDDLADYGINPVITPNDTIYTSDLIRRRWLDNDFYGTVFSLDYKYSNKLNIVFGGGVNKYIGDHFGEVIWARFAGSSEIRDRYYENQADKTDVNSYAKFNYQLLSNLNIFADIQLRTIDYNFLGYDNNLNNITQNARYTFINPKAGFTYKPNYNQKIYGLFAVANKEPNRDDLTQSTPNSRPQHENLNDFELGYEWNTYRFSLGANVYHMAYNNQLIPTGELNDVGASVRTNVPKSNRTGIELQTGINITKGLTWKINASFSQNKIKEWTEYVDNWDTWGKDTIVHSNTDIAFSPSIVASSIIEFNPYKQFDGSKVTNRIDDWTISFVSKYVGKQYIDNTQSDLRALDPYLIHNLRMNYRVAIRKWGEIHLFGSINNVFNELYSANAWVYRYSYGGDYYDLNGYYPQAERNFLIGINIKFKQEDKTPRGGDIILLE